MLIGQGAKVGTSAGEPDANLKKRLYCTVTWTSAPELPPGTLV